MSTYQLKTSIKRYSDHKLYVQTMPCNAQLNGDIACSTLAPTQPNTMESKNVFDTRAKIRISQTLRYRKLASGTLDTTHNPLCSFCQCALHIHSNYDACLHQSTYKRATFPTGKRAIDTSMGPVWQRPLHSCAALVQRPTVVVVVHLLQLPSLQLCVGLRIRASGDLARRLMLLALLVSEWRLGCHLTSGNEEVSGLKDSL